MRRAWRAAKAGTLLPSLGCLRPLPLHTSPPCPHRRKEEWMGQCLKLLCPSQALTGHKVTGISQQRTACGNHIRAVLSPLLELGLGKALQLGEVGNSPFANPSLLRPKPRPSVCVGFPSGGPGAVQEESQISGIHAFKQTPRRHFLPQTKCEV